jgi:hypothetical protein
MSPELEAQIRAALAAAEAERDRAVLAANVAQGKILALSALLEKARPADGNTGRD